MSDQVCQTIQSLSCHPGSGRGAVGLFLPIRPYFKWFCCGSGYAADAAPPSRRAGRDPGCPYRFFQALCGRSLSDGCDRRIADRIGDKPAGMVYHGWQTKAKDTGLRGIICRSALNRQEKKCRIREKSRFCGGGQRQSDHEYISAEGD